MLFTDINVLVYARRPESPFHVECKRWLEDVVNGDTTFGLPEATQSGFLRVVTDQRIFRIPTSMADALAFLADIRSSDSYSPVVPGRRHWRIFSELCLSGSVSGNLVPDAYLAALAIEADAELVSCDRDFGNFPGLRWFNPAK